MLEKPRVFMAGRLEFPDFLFGVSQSVPPNPKFRASAPGQSAPINILTFEERREFWTSLRQALLPIPEAYEAVNKLLAARVEANRIEHNGEHRDPGTLSKNGSAG